jgi:hypothetical protein
MANVNTPAIISSINGRYVVIRRIDDNTQINITELEIYDNTNNKIIYDDSNIKVSSVNILKDPKKNKVGKDKLYDNDTTANESIYNFYISDSNDKKATIIISFEKNYDISSIKIYGRPAASNTLLNGVYVEIYDENKELVFSQKITVGTNALVTINTRQQPQEYNSNQCIELKQCCVAPLKTNYNTTLDNMSSRVNNMINNTITNITTKIENINRMITNLNNKQIDDFRNLNDAFLSNSAKINTLNTRLTNVSNNSGYQQKTIQVNSNYLNPVDTLIEIAAFTNYNSNNHNLSSTRDKKLEKFANFIKPNINVYEKFTNWENDWNKNLTNVKYIPIRETKNIAGQNVDTVIPVIDQTDMINKMDNSVSKLISNKIIKNGNKIVNYK